MSYVDTSRSYIVDPRANLIDTSHPTLNYLLHKEYNFATVDEYARAAHLSVQEVISLLSPWMDRKLLGVEVYGMDIFLVTAPVSGRDMKGGNEKFPTVPPNLWERLRTNMPIEQAHSLWLQIRALEKAGWRVETNPAVIEFKSGKIPKPARIAVYVKQHPIPVVILPSIDDLKTRNGVLSMYYYAEAKAVAITCYSRALDDVTTAVRTWYNSFGTKSPDIAVMVLEAPMYNPVILTSQEGSIKPVSIVRGV